MTYLESAIRILSDAGRPMTAHEITFEALKRRLIRPVGRTPAATMTSTLYVEAKRARPLVVRKYDSGHQRARRGSVRWTLPRTRAQ